MGLSVGDKTVSEFTVGNTPIKQGADEGSLFRGKNRKTFSYTGSEQSFTAPADGYYVLECWGASGGNDNRGNLGGRGGYAKGKLYLTAGTILKIYVGGKGKDNPGGLTDYSFNGGGRGGRSDYRSSNRGNGGGGGGTDIRIGGNTLYHRLIVGGGGGGASPNQGGNNWTTMCGGGEQGNSPRSGAQGTQTDGNAFGVGFSSNCNNEGNRYSCNGGGGGWYGGGKGGSTGSSDSRSDSFYAGGGSGFVWEGQDTVPSGYLVSEDYVLDETENIKGNEEMPNTTGTGTMTGNVGNGCVVISFSYGSKSEKITQAGIYHNEELGLISMSADGQNRITIDDKNAGAWSNDIEDELSYGGYFQFGNSHGFGELPEPVPPEPTNPREPGEHTLAYYKLEGNTDDYMGNYASGGNSNIDYETLASGQQVVKLTSSNAGIMIPGGIANAIGSGDFTISLWVYVTGLQGGSGMIFGSWYDTSPYPGPNIWRRYDADIIRFRIDSNTYMDAISIPSTFENARRVHICWTRINGVNYGYINGEQECSMSNSTGISNGNAGYMISRYGSQQSLATGSMGSKVICENIGRPASKVRAYYNWNKSLYGIN